MVHNFILEFLILFVLFTLSYKDWIHGILPNGLLFFLLVLIVLRQMALQSCFSFHCSWFLFFLAAFLKVSYALGRQQDGLGWGDVKFFAVCGLGIEWPHLPLFLILSGGGGLVTACLWRIKGKGPTFPLGPGIAAAFESLLACGLY